MPWLEMETSGPDHLHTGLGDVASAGTGAMIGDRGTKPSPTSQSLRAKPRGQTWSPCSRVASVGWHSEESNQLIEQHLS
jgi:hypothetical protein